VGLSLLLVVFFSAAGDNRADASIAAAASQDRRMTYPLGEIASYARTPVGRRKLIVKLRGRTWPVMRALGTLYRRTWLRPLRLIAVSGSFGKSSAVQLIVAALDLPLTDRIRNRNNGLWTVQRDLLATRRREKLAVFEVGIDRCGQMVPQARALQPDVAVITAVGGEHLENMGSIEAIAFEKSRLVHGLRPTGIAVLNGDDARVRAMAEVAPGEVWTFGLGPENDARAVDVADDWPNGSRFTAVVRGERVDVRLPLIGHHTIRLAVAALAVAKIAGVPLDAAAARLATMSRVGRRLDTLSLANGVTLLCDHEKNSIESLTVALEALAQAPGRKVLVVSAIRAATEDMAPLFEKAAALFARTVDEAVVIGPGVERLIEPVRATGFPAGRIHQTAPGILDAITTVQGVLRPGDTVLLKGRIPQKLDRLILALQGRKVVCNLEVCETPGWYCESCAMLETGFADRVRLG
jgi:UDP-N-acetylmuramoyl-tripeptide--D-alanyl-D-alanine ligase